MLGGRSSLNRWTTTASPARGAHCRRKAQLRAEVALYGFQPVIAYPQILYVAKRFVVLGATNVQHERFIAAAEDPQQLKSIDKIDLCLPALLLEGAFIDVVVAGRTRKCEVVCQQGV